MKILFILKKPAIAGVETLALRLIRELIDEHQDEVGLLFLVQTKSSTFFNNLHPSCVVYNALSRRSLRQVYQQNWDIIFGFESFGLLFALWLNCSLKKSANICLGGYHPLEYAWQPLRSSYIKNLIARMVAMIPQKNIIFMNDEVRERNETLLGISKSQSHIIPLPIDTARFTTIKRQPKKGELISIGRLVDFKTYNLHMIPVLKQLIGRGYNVIYKVYGEGELRKPMQDLAQKYGVAEHVLFMGAIPYEKLHKPFETAHCFIGCGTSLVEAAAAGIPSIFGIEASNEPLTYGFFSEIDGYNVGEINPYRPQVSYLEKIESVLKLNHEEYESLSEAHRVQAQKFALKKVVAQYRRVFTESQSTPNGISDFDFWRWIILYFLYKILLVFGIKNVLANRYIEGRSL